MKQPTMMTNFMTKHCSWNRKRLKRSSQVLFCALILPCSKRRFGSAFSRFICLAWLYPQSTTTLSPLCKLFTILHWKLLPSGNKQQGNGPYTQTIFPFLADTLILYRTNGLQNLREYHFNGYRESSWILKFVPATIILQDSISFCVLLKHLL